MASLHGKKMDTLLQSVSVIVSIVSYSSEGGNFMMKSIAIVSKGLAFSSGVMGESGGWVGCVDFIHLACCTAANVLCYKGFHIGPPIVRHEKLQSF